MNNFPIRMYDQLIIANILLCIHILVYNLLNEYIFVIQTRAKGPRFSYFKVISTVSASIPIFNSHQFAIPSDIYKVT